MEIKCPRCGNSAVELIECDICKSIGCVKCITKHGKQWVCDKCKNMQYTTESAESALSSMF